MEDLRTVLIITLAILVVVILFRRFNQYVKRRHAPVPRDMELVALEVMYHPAVLRVQVDMPAPGRIFPAMLSQAHAPLHSWPAVQMAPGEQVLELPLADDVDGIYFFEIATATQRTERRFTVRRA